MNKLPPAPRLLIEGDVAAAAPYVGLAKKLARQCYQSGVRAKSYLVAAGTTIRVENYPESYLSKVFIRSAPGGFPFLAVTWEPEGIVLTPRTAAAPYGYGFPKRDAETGELINAPFGTVIGGAADSALNQVLINQFANNKYLDRAEYVSGIPEVNGKPVFELPETNPRLRDAVATEIPRKTHHTVIYWPLFFEPHHIDSEFWSLDENKVDWIDAPGINRWTAGYEFAPKKKPDEGEEVVYRQFDSNHESLIYESETEDWFAHWPEELLYDNEAYEFVFKGTNAVRANVGEEPIVREIRGFANISRMVLSEMQRAKVQFHDNEELYRPGYGTVLSRNLQGGNNFIAGGENLVSGIPAGFTTANAVIAVQGWINSPGHYANMISSNWSSPKQATTLDVFGNVACAITESGPPDPEEFDPAISGRSYAQSFVNYNRWLYTGTTGVNEFTFDNSTTPVTHAPFGNMAYFSYKGRLIQFSPAKIRQELESVISGILGITSYLDSDGKKNIRVICGFTKLETEYKSLCCYTHPLVSPDPFGEESEWTLECEDTDIYKDILIRSIVSFSADGMIGLFSGERDRRDTQASFYFPLNSSDPIGYLHDQVVIKYENKVFSISESTFGPTIVHTVETQTYGPVGAPEQNTRISRYRQSGSGTLTYFPFYNEDGEIVYLKQHIELDVDQTYDGTTDTSYYKAIHSFEFPSGSILESVHQVVEDGDPIGPCYFLIFFYFDLLQEEAVYLRIDLTKVPPFAAHGNYTLYYWHNNVETVIKDYGTALINSSQGFRKPQLRASWVTSSGPSTGQKASGSIDTHFTRGSDASKVFYPINGVAGGQRWRCVDRPDIEYFPGSLITGSYPMGMRNRVGNYTQCFSGTVDGLNYYENGYSVGIPIIDPIDDDAVGYFAHYKDKIVVQTFFNSLWNKNLTGDDRIKIWANFDLEGLLGVGPLTRVSPMGVIR